MSAPLRSKQGCWTCKLRRKKCDEIHPHCSTCESLSITCYGFGPKPEWMDNGDQERAVVKSLREIIKHRSRRKIASQLSKPHGSVIKIAPKSAKASAKTSSRLESEPQNDGNLLPSDHLASVNDVNGTLHDGSAVSTMFIYRSQHILMASRVTCRMTVMIEWQGPRSRSRRRSLYS